MMRVAQIRTGDWVKDPVFLLFTILVCIAKSLMCDAEVYN